MCYCIVVRISWISWICWICWILCLAAIASTASDFVGARDAGMRAVLLDRFGRDAPDEESSEGKEWREAGAAVVHDLSDVLEHVARSDFALGCHE